MTDSDADQGRQTLSALQRVVEAARHGHARLNAYRQEKSALGTWLRSHLFRQGSKGQQTQVGRSLRSAVTARRLRQRQEVYRNGDRHSSTAFYALQRAAQAVYRKKRR
ncbi:MAG: hypothetical protein Kow0063_22660 [Anaerolineae bacterium]